MRMNTNAPNTPKYLPSKRVAFWGSQTFTALLLGGLIALSVLMYQARHALELARQNEVIRARLELLHQQEMAKLAAELKVQEIALMKEFDCMRLTLFWESQRHNEEDMMEIGRNIMTRVDSPAYPASICGVVNEVRLKADGTKVAMYPYIFDNRGRPRANHPDWKLAGRVTHLVMLAHAEGRLAKGAINYHAPYVSPRWAKVGVERCQLEVMETEGYHLFYAEVPRAERKDCLAQRAMAAAESKKKHDTFVLPKEGPVPAKRPAKQDDVASLILAAN